MLAVSVSIDHRIARSLGRFSCGADCSRYTHTHRMRQNTNIIDVLAHTYKATEKENPV